MLKLALGEKNVENRSDLKTTLHPSDPSAES